ncbi:hypothetical protein H5410_028785, partial [Solanum commersonii]
HTIPTIPKALIYNLSPAISAEFSSITKAKEEEEEEEKQFFLRVPSVVVEFFCGRKLGF